MPRPSLLLSLTLTLTAACAATVVDPPGDPCGSWQVVADVVLSWTPDASPAVLRGQCLRETPRLRSANEPACAVLQARPSAGACTCDPAEGRGPVSADHQPLAEAFMSSDFVREAGWDCLCEIVQLTGDAAATCREDPGDDVTAGGAAVNGFCYVDATATPPVGNPEITGHCPTEEQRLLRFVGEGTAVTSAGMRMVCQPACPPTPAVP
jgi:hypothetical protein